MKMRDSWNVWRCKVNGKTDTIPTKTSELENDSGYITSANVPTKTSELENDSGYITSASVPTKTSELENDSGYITSASVPTKTSELENDSGFITNNDLPTVNNGKLSISVNETLVSEFTANQSGNSNVDISVPTKTSEIENDSGYITNAGVTGVKGDNEANYRTGDVNITAANIGLGNVPNVTTNDQTPTFSQAGSRANIASGEKLSVIFGKIMKWFADLASVAFSGSYNDLSNKPTIPTVNNGKLTMTFNNVSFLEFTANQSSNASYNISVPVFHTVNKNFTSQTLATGADYDFDTGLLGSQVFDVGCLFIGWGLYPYNIYTASNDHVHIVFRNLNAYSVTLSTSDFVTIKYYKFG